MTRIKDIHGGNIWDAAKSIGKRAEDIVDFSSSVNPHGIPKGAARAARAAMGLLAAYPDPGSKALIAGLSGYLGVRKECIIPGNGSTELIHLLPQVVRCAKALIAEPAFSEYRVALNNAGVRVFSLRLKESDGFAIDLGALEGELKKRPCALFFMANPQNPTGAVTERKVVLEIARVCARRGATLVVDEAFVDFNETLSICLDAVKLNNVIVLRSATKFFSLAGLRAGYAVSNPGVIERFSRLIPPWSVNTIATHACIEALKDKGYILKTQRWLSRERGFLMKELGRIGALKAYPAGANYIMLKIRSGRVNAPCLGRELAKTGLLIRDLSGFIGLGDKYFRVAIKSHVDNVKLVNVLSGFFE